MALRLVIVGPGRVGSALGRAWATHGIDVLGFVGRRAGTAGEAVAFAGCGRELRTADHDQAHVVVFAVGDGDLAGAVAGLCAAARPRACSLWLHTSGVHDLAPLQPAADAGARIGSLHPVVPFPDAAAGHAALPGGPGVIAAGPRSRGLLVRLCERAGLVPFVADGGDRVLYHAGCALAANGLVALRSVVDDVLAAAGGLGADARRAVADALMRAAVAGASARGAAAALSGPVRRGDAATVGRHRQALVSLGAEPVYRALMARALELAKAQGLPAERAAAVQRVLDGG